MNSYPLEGLLRSPVELVAILPLSILLLVVVTAPEWLLIPKDLQWFVAAGLTLLVSWRCVNCWSLVRYQFNLQHRVFTSAKTSALPAKKGGLFLGLGFQWSAIHTQRLRDVDANSDKLPFLTRIGRRNLKIGGKKPDVSGRFEIHGVGQTEEQVLQNQSDRNGHTLVIGTTRVGKTRLAELLITQDIHDHQTVIVFDPKGDRELLNRIHYEADQAGRLDDLRVFHLGYPQYSQRYNPIGRFSRITEVATRIANQLPNEGEAAAFREFAWRFINIIARALTVLDQTPNYQLIRRYINDIEPLFIQYSEYYLHRFGKKGWHKTVERASESQSDKSAKLNNRTPLAAAYLDYLQSQEVDDPVMEGLLSAYKYDRTYFDKIVSSVGPLMEKLTTGAIAELISPHNEPEDEHRPIFDWLDLINSRGILYVGLDALSDNVIAAAIGNSMFADLVSVAGHIYKFGTESDESNPEQNNPKICIHTDEFNELIGDEFIPLLNKAGGAGFQVTAYTQTWSDIQARLGSSAKAAQVTGNFNTLLMLRVRELQTAELLTSQLPRVKVLNLVGASGVSDANDVDDDSDFQSRNEDKLTQTEVPLVGPPELFALPKGHAFALLGGGQLYKLRIPMLSEIKVLEPQVLMQKVLGEREVAEPTPDVESCPE